VHRLSKSAFFLKSLRSWLAVLLLIYPAYCFGADAQAIAAALTQSVQGSHASAVVLDLRAGTVLAAVGDPGSGVSGHSVPGSAIKPLLLEYALEHGIIRPETEVYCRRDLRIGARALPCTHPPDHPVFTAESALAESCNTWFAEMAKRYTGAQLEDALEATRLPHTSMLSASVPQRQLAVLGLEGVTASPLQLAQAYRDLLLRAPASGPVVQGLADSVNYGMANQAAVRGMTILGKTGTASNPGESWTHGWFAGALPGRFALVIYVPHGDGGTAALLAHKFFQAINSDGHSQ